MADAQAAGCLGYYGAFVPDEPVQSAAVDVLQVASGQLEIVDEVRWRLPESWFAVGSMAGEELACVRFDWQVSLSTVGVHIRG